MRLLLAVDAGIPAARHLRMLRKHRSGVVVCFDDCAAERKHDILLNHTPCMHAAGGRHQGKRVAQPADG